LALRTNKTPLLTVDEIRGRGEEITVDVAPIYEHEADLGGDVEDSGVSTR
jgi:hypothetical protein